MFRQNPITDSSLAYLREAHPHRRWHFVVLLIALSIGSIFIWRGYTIDNLSTIYTGRNHCTDILVFSIPHHAISK